MVSEFWVVPMRSLYAPTGRYTSVSSSKTSSLSFVLRSLKVATCNSSASDESRALWDAFW